MLTRGSVSELPNALVAVMSASLLAPSCAVPTPFGAVKTTATSGCPVAIATLAVDGTEEARNGLTRKKLGQGSVAE